MPIQVLPPQLANQIAAGEVVERPASVVKELVENSLDAGATRIDIDIERGGAKLIRIRDNGSGIKKDELALALARHATSKIASLDDLEAIISLGFRGEALASISSVARLTLTSRTAEQQEAWQAYAEGRDQAVTVKPAAHPVGTTLEVLDLFYNTPARRKFMRTEKTEFGHIDEVVRRIALARFDVTINLSHNGKVMRQYRAVAQDGQRERRLGTICGAAFLEHALAIEWQHGDLTLRGWVADPLHTTPALAEIQYCYVNVAILNFRQRRGGMQRIGDPAAQGQIAMLPLDRQRMFEKSGAANCPQPALALAILSDCPILAHHLAVMAEVDSDVETRQRNAAHHLVNVAELGLFGAHKFAPRRGVIEQIEDFQSGTDRVRRRLHRHRLIAAFSIRLPGFLLLRRARSQR